MSAPSANNSTGTTKGPLTSTAGGLFANIGAISQSGAAAGGLFSGLGAPPTGGGGMFGSSNPGNALPSLFGNAPKPDEAKKDEEKKETSEGGMFGKNTAPSNPGSLFEGIMKIPTPVPNVKETADLDKKATTPAT